MRCRGSWAGTRYRIWADGSCRDQERPGTRLFVEPKQGQTYTEYDLGCRSQADCNGKTFTVAGQGSVLCTFADDMLIMTNDVQTLQHAYAYEAAWMVANVTGLKLQVKGKKSARGVRLTGCRMARRET